MIHEDEQPPQTTNYPRQRSTKLQHLEGGTLEAFEVKENEFAAFSLYLNGKPTGTQYRTPEGAWSEYRARVITEADHIAAHAFGITLEYDRPVIVSPPRTAAVEEAEVDFKKRWFKDSDFAAK
jgi:hypothetical protein